MSFLPSICLQHPLFYKSTSTPNSEPRQLIWHHLSNISPLHFNFLLFHLTFYSASCIRNLTLLTHLFQNEKKHHPVYPIRDHSHPAKNLNLSWLRERGLQQKHLLFTTLFLSTSLKLCFPPTQHLKLYFCILSGKMGRCNCNRVLLTRCVSPYLFTFEDGLFLCFKNSLGNMDHRLIGTAKGVKGKIGLRVYYVSKARDFTVPLI